MVIFATVRMVLLWHSFFFLLSQLEIALNFQFRFILTKASFRYQFQLYFGFFFCSYIFTLSMFPSFLLTAALFYLYHHSCYPAQLYPHCFKFFLCINSFQNYVESKLLERIIAMPLQCQSNILDSIVLQMTRYRLAHFLCA